MFSLQGKTAVVTGAGGGLGRSFSQALAAQGARVLCGDIDLVAARETAQSIEASGGEATATKVDVSDEASVREFAAGVGRCTDRLEILINNAGVASIPCRLLDLETSEWDRVVAVNLRSLFLVSRSLLPVLIRAEGSSVINLSSYLGMVGAYPGFPVTAIAYGATKAGVIGFTRQMAIEYAPEKVRVNCIAPGWHFGTNLGQARRAVSSDAENERFLKAALDGIPLGRFGSPEDLSGLLIYLASDASKYVTGQVFAQDGGITAS